MKRSIALVLLLVTVFSLLALPGCSGNPRKLSTLSEEECMAFLAEMHVDIPDALIEQGADVPQMVKSILSQLEENPDMPCQISDTRVWELFEEIQGAVKKYYGQS